MSLYLDLVRFSAAVAVFLDHLTSFPFIGTVDEIRHGWRLIGNYGTTAVTLFFLLSGYVIAYVTDTRETDGRSYTISRVSRLYSVVIPALLVTLVCDTLGQRLAPQIYALPKILHEAPSVAGYLSSLLFINEFRFMGIDGLVPGSNAPFWSLSFEATYYAVAGLVLFTRPRIAIPASLLLLAAAGPTIAILLPLWIMGYLVYRWRDRLQQMLVLPLASFLVSGGLILVIPVLFEPITGEQLGLSFPFGRGDVERDLGKDYLTALAFAIHLVAARKLFSRFPDLLSAAPKGRKAIRFAGATTFPLYAMHFPLLALAAGISPFHRDGLPHIVWLCLTVGLSVALATPICDRLKDVLRDKLDEPR